MSAQSAQMMKNENGVDVRKVIGPARFLHNNTYLICDTALWYVEARVINAFGHVKILQDETVLTSDKLDYYIDDDLAQFRGSVVQLQDKERNTLRTRNLDYNTKDSVAVFRYGASMKDKDGQIIESDNGSYDSKTKLFTFNRNVNMFTDSVFVNTSNLLFHGDTQVAEFDQGVDAWKDDDMLSADRGYYDRDQETFRFYDNVHAMTDIQEGWADTLHFFKSNRNLEMYGNVQLRDTSRRLSAMAESVNYVDSTATLTMQTNATIVAEVEDSTAAPGAAMDTIYVGADKVIYWTHYRCAIEEAEVSASKKRLEDIALDPVAEYRKRAAEAAAAAAEEAKRKREQEMGIKPGAAGNEAGEQGAENAGVEEPEPAARPEAEEEKPSTPAPDAGEESGPEAESETTEPAADSTKVGFVTVIGNVRVFKSDMQARCDSLSYNELDSLARLYLDPIVWNEGTRQYSADSIAIRSENGHMRKADLMSNAFITIQEDTICFDQIRGTEMMAFFDSTTVLERFDALGGASAVFFLEENDALATVNKVESKMLTANFLNGEIEKIWYYDKPHNDAYPSVQLPSEDRQMKGFRWNPDMRPAGKEDVTPYDLRPLERDEYSTRQKPVFRETDIYFPGYMKQVYASIAQRDSIRREEKLRADAGLDIPAEADSSEVLSENTETGQPEETELTETEATPANEQETAVVQPEEQVSQQPESVPESEEKPSEPSEAAEKKETVTETQTSEPENREVEVDLKDLPDYLKAQKEAQKEEARKAREAALADKQARKDAKWAELDAKDAAKDAKKAEKRSRRLEKQNAKYEKIMAKETAREQKLFDRYVKHYRKQKRAQVFKAIAKSEKAASKKSAEDNSKPEQTEQ